MENPEQHAALGRHLWTILRFVKPYKGHVVLGLCSNGLARFFDLLPLVIVGRLIDYLNRAEQGATAAGSDLFLGFSLIILGTFLGLALFQSLSNYTLGSMAQKVRHDIRVQLYEHLQRMDVSFFENRQTGDIMAVVSNDVDNLENFLADASTSIVRIVITLVGMFGFLFWLDWRLALLLFAPLPFAVLAVRFFATKVQPQYRRARQAVGAVNSILENNIQGIGVIQAYTAEKHQAERVGRQSEEYRNAAIAAARERAFFVPLIYAIAGIAFAGLTGFGGWLTLTEYGPSLGDYTTFILMALRMVLPLFVFGMLINQIQRSEASAKRINDLFSTTPAVSNASGAKDLATPPVRIEFDHVRFAYTGRKLVINGVNFALERGRMIGVVGPTGAGKSTLIKLLLRYYEPSAGEIRINGRSYGGLTLESVRNHIGYVSQEAFLFFGTIAENIRLGSPDAEDESVREAARIAGADEFIRELPSGYETVVGERGVKLSGGQRQRISLARAVLRNPAVLVLDEATSAVDTRTEEIIQQNLYRFRRDRMTLAVAHRLSTVRNSDEIIVLVDGMVVERGNHKALLEKNGVYSGLWSIQSGDIENIPPDSSLPPE
ncbi:MAG: ABC transporter ATP-binding protein [Desulfovibrionales bacterium]